jgi:hypothetical protein
VTFINAALAALCLATLSSAPLAQELRCRNDHASKGDTKAAVVMKCGEPVFRDSFCKPKRPTCETVDLWTYNPGSGQFLTTLRFESGALVSMQYGDRVK